MNTRAAADPEKESVFRAGYARGWIGAVDAFAQLLADRHMTPAQAAEVLREHKAQALDKWAGERLQAGLYPPRVPRKTAYR
jgi:hypothetical protein